MTRAAPIYLDHAATTPVLPEARAAMAEALQSWANPSSPHALGRAARAALESSRRQIAETLGWDGDVILTSGATEAIAIASARAASPGRVIGPTEHAAVPAAMGDAPLLRADPNGLIDLAQLDELVAAGPSLVAIQHVNNETGVIQPLREIAERVRGAGSLLLADCAQSAGKLPLPDADFIAISGHKFGAPPGIGALLVRDLATLRATGGQERGYRRGTENAPAAAAMAAALQSNSFVKAAPSIAALRERLETALEADRAVVIGKQAERSPFIGMYAMPGVSSSSQLVQFDLAGIAISAGSACTSGSLKSSGVLEAMRVPENWNSSAVVRVSFGPDTTESDVDGFVLEWRRIAEKARVRAA